MYSRVTEQLKTICPVSAASSTGRRNTDGLVDVLVGVNGAAPVLLQNQAGAANHWLGIKLQGVTCNRDAIGATVRLYSNGQIQSRLVRTGSSYLSQSELPLTFGVGKQDVIEKITIDWPSGRTEDYPKLKSGKSYQLTESNGVTEL